MGSPHLQPHRASRVRYQQASQTISPVAFRLLGPVLSRVYGRRFVLVGCPLLNQALGQVLDLRRGLQRSLQRSLVISQMLLRPVNLLLVQLRSRLVNLPHSRHPHQARSLVLSQAVNPLLSQPPGPLRSLLRCQADNQRVYRAVNPVDNL
jgi:hypothetical protein